MGDKGSLGKGQASGMTASRIGLGRATINSGYCSGRSDLKEVLENDKEENRKKSHKRSRSLDLKRCKGTDWSYNDANSANINLARNTRDLGAFSGDSKKTSGTLGIGNKGSSQTTTGKTGVAGKAGSQTPTDSKVIGTRESFNLGIHVVTTDKSFDKVRGKLNEGNEKDNLLNKKSWGTSGSFNAIEGSKIDANRAIINSGCGAGITDKVKLEYLQAEIKNNWENHYKGYECWGTEKSFNAKGLGKEINIRGATLNAGAFAGIGTGQASTSRRSRSN